MKYVAYYMWVVLITLRTIVFRFTVFVLFYSFISLNFVNSQELLSIIDAPRSDTIDLGNFNPNAQRSITSQRDNNTLGNIASQIEEELLPILIGDGHNIDKEGFDAIFYWLAYKKDKLRKEDIYLTNNDLIGSARVLISKQNLLEANSRIYKEHKNFNFIQYDGYSYWYLGLHAYIDKDFIHMRQYVDYIKNSRNDLLISSAQILERDYALESNQENILLRDFLSNQSSLDNEINLQKLQLESILNNSSNVTSQEKEILSDQLHDAILNNNHTDRIIYGSSILQLDSGAIGIFDILASSYEQKGRLNSSLFFLEQAQKANPTSDRAKVIISHLLSTEQLDMAQEYLNDIKLNNNSSADFLQADIYIKSGQYNDAEKIYQNYLENSSFSNSKQLADAYSNLAREQYDKLLIHSASISIANSLNIHPDIDNYLIYADISVKRGDYLSAFSAYQNINKLNTNSEQYIENLDSLLSKSFEIDPSVRQVSLIANIIYEIIRIDSSFERQRKIYYRVLDYKEISNNISFTSISEVYNYAANRHKRYPETAFRYLTWSLEIDPNNYQALSLLSSLQRQEGYLSDALSNYQRLIDSGHNVSENKTNFVRSSEEYTSNLIRDRKYEEAISATQNALSYESSLILMRNQAEALVMARRYEEAIPILKILSSQGDNKSLLFLAFARRFTALDEYENGNWFDALEEFEEIAQIYTIEYELSIYFETYLLITESYLRLNRPDTAKKVWNRVNSLDIDKILVSSSLNSSYIKHSVTISTFFLDYGFGVESAQASDVANKLNRNHNEPDNFDFYLSKGKENMGMRQYTSASYYLNLAYRLENSEDVRYLLANAYYNSKQYEQAVNLLESLDSRDNDKIRYAYAQIAIRKFQNDYELAKSNILSAHELGADIEYFTSMRDSIQPDRYIYWVSFVNESLSSGNSNDNLAQSTSTIYTDEVQSEQAQSYTSTANNDQIGLAGLANTTTSSGSQIDISQSENLNGSSSNTLDTDNNSNNNASTLSFRDFNLMAVEAIKQRNWKDAVNWTKKSLELDRSARNRQQVYYMYLEIADGFFEDKSYQNAFIYYESLSEYDNRDNLAKIYERMGDIKFFQKDIILANSYWKRAADSSNSISINLDQKLRNTNFLQLRLISDNIDSLIENLKDTSVEAEYKNLPEYRVFLSSLNNQRALSSIEEGDFFKAEQYLYEAEQYDPENAQALQLRAHMSQVKGEWDRAIFYLQKARRSLEDTHQIDQRIYSAYLRYSHSLDTQGDTEQAIAMATHALGLDVPDKNEAFNLLISLNKKIGKNDLVDFYTKQLENL